MPSPSPSSPRPRPTPVGVIRRARAAWRRMEPFIGSSRRLLWVSAVGSVAAGLVEAGLLALIAAVAQALSTGQGSVSAPLGGRSWDAGLGALIWVGVGLALVRALLQLYLAHLPARLSSTVNATLQRRLFDAFTRASWSVQSAERDGHFQALIGTHVTSSSQAVLVLSSGISAAFMFLTLLASAFALNLWTALALIVVSTLLFAVLQPFAGRLRQYSRTLSAQNVAFTQGVQEVVHMAEEVQVFGVSTAYRREVDELVEGVRRPLERTRFLSRAVPGLYQSMALFFLILALAVVHVVGVSDVALLGGVVLILIRSLTFGQQVQASLSTLDTLLPFMHRLSDALAVYDAEPRQSGARELESVETLQVDDVRFSYGDGDPVLRGVSCTVRRGEALGIVGPSGAGKSSLVQVLLRLRDPDGGALLVNGGDARELDLASWQARVAYVPQDPQLVHATVAENIRFFRPWITDEQVVEAARRAHVHDDVLSWSDGYDTVVGQRAAGVSGGQRQRLCLARALAGQPDVLVLDEPTSALDVKSEHLVQQSLQEVKADVALVLVAHRLSTLAVCDQVLVLADGRVQAVGTPAQLAEEDAFFREVTRITREQAGSSV